MRYSTFAAVAPAKAQLVVAVTAISGYLPVLRYAGNGWTTSAAPWPGDTGGLLPGLLAAMRGEPALQLTALRHPISAGNAKYAVLRYDAFGSGEAALAVVNLDPATTAAELSLTGIPPQLLGQRPRPIFCPGCSEQLPRLDRQYNISVGSNGYTVLGGLQLPRWVTAGYKFNCTAEYAPPSAGEMPLARCLVSCLADPRCDAVTVDWVHKQAWPRPAEMSWYTNLVQCNLRGGLNISRCADAEDQAHSTLAVA